jgi:uncharacterized protein
VGLIYLDSCVVIYAFERHPLYASRVLAALVEAKSEGFAISPLVKLECLVGPMRTGNLVLQRYYEEGLSRFVSLPLSDEVFLQAAELRARFGLKTPDALHLAAAQHHACDALWTNDDRLAHAAHGLAVNVLA